MSDSPTIRPDPDLLAHLATDVGLAPEELIDDDLDPADPDATMAHLVTDTQMTEEQFRQETGAEDPKPSLGGIAGQLD